MLVTVPDSGSSIKSTGNTRSVCRLCGGCIQRPVSIPDHRPCTVIERKPAVPAPWEMAAGIVGALLSSKSNVSGGLLDRHSFVVENGSTPPVVVQIYHHNNRRPRLNFLPPLSFVALSTSHRSKLAGIEAYGNGAPPPLGRSGDTIQQLSVCIGSCKQEGAVHPKRC
jgi:hypothetical protein